MLHPRIKPSPSGCRVEFKGVESRVYQGGNFFVCLCKLRVLASIFLANKNNYIKGNRLLRVVYSLSLYSGTLRRLQVAQLTKIRGGTR